ncbi:hypothetical protein [Kitasatospora herbaricolor]|uniref:Uncharacterized protein n=1 Tax=Kitasatospora herbaricolor TaxID=68217 RepID=A0ABZ1W9J2_9ACTN|nr:hypothetical protein [Kitasatospora herbaricolor]
MLTLGGPGTLRQRRRTAPATAAELRDVDFAPIRVKIEATPWTSGVPATDAAAERPPAFFCRLPRGRRSRHAEGPTE